MLDKVHIQKKIKKKESYKTDITDDSFWSEDFRIKRVFKWFLDLTLGRSRNMDLQLVRGAGGSFFLKLASVGFALFTSLILTRLMGTREYGVYAYAVSWATLFSSFALIGHDNLIIREVAHYKTKKNWNSLLGIIRWSFWITLSASIFVAILFSIIVLILPDWFYYEMRVALWVAMLLVPLLSLLVLYKGTIQGLGYVIEAQVPEMLILPVIFLIAILVLFAVFDLSGTLVLFARLICCLLAVIVAQALVMMRLPKNVNNLSASYHMSSWIKSGFPLFFIGLSGVINQYMPTVMVGTFLGPEEAGIFHIVSRLALFVSFPLMAVNMPLAPLVSGLYSRDSINILQQSFTKSARLGVLGASILVSVFLVFGHLILRIFGEDFVQGYILLLIISTGHFINAAMGSVGLVLVMTGNEVYAAIGHGISAIICFILNFVLIYFIGIIGAGIAVALSMIVWNLLLSFWLYKKLGLIPTAFAKLSKEGMDG